MYKRTLYGEMAKLPNLVLSALRIVFTWAPSYICTSPKLLALSSSQNCKNPPLHSKTFKNGCLDLGSSLAPKRTKEQWLRAAAQPQNSLLSHSLSLFKIAPCAWQRPCEWPQGIVNALP
jgi:hypothetical protein